MRMGEETRRIPKPMIEIGGKPILWHIMRYYAGWGFKEFIICLGYKGDVVKEYFLGYNEALFSDFVLERDGSGTRVEILSNDLNDWKITFADTGVNTTIGERLKAVERYIGSDNVFLATYGDGLTDAPLPDLISAFEESGKTAMFLSVKPVFNAHMIRTDAEGTVLSVEDMSLSDVRINGGFFILKRRVLDLIEPGDELVEETFARLIEEGELIAYEYDGFFGPMDTIKDRQRLEALHETGRAPWQHTPQDELREHPVV